MRRTRISLLLVLGMVAALLPMGAIAPAAATTGDLVITGVVDGPLTGGLPKAVEFYAVNNIADLSVYGFGSANNGGGSDGEEFTFPADSAAAGEFLYVATEVPNFNTFFGFDPDYTDGSAPNINGDDAIELFKEGAVVDVLGDINTDGTGEDWEHLDGWAYRVDGEGQDGATFVLANWYFSGVGALIGESTNATAGTPFPIGSYAATVVDVAPTVSSTSPANLDTDVALDADIEITFSEAVTVTGSWFSIVCDSGAHTATVSGGPTIFTLNPDADFTNDEDCTVTVFAASVTDTDGVADEMAEDRSFSFTVVGTATVPATVVINEVDYDQPGTDGAEFVELKNVGTTDADLSAVILELVNGNGGGAAIYQSFALPAQSLAAGEYFVVCGDAANVPNCDFDVSPNTNLVQNGAPDAVSILYNGELVDVVSYEGDTAAPYTEGSGVGLEDPSSTDSVGISRAVDGVDTDQNNVDFAVRCVTPGAANSASASDCGPQVPPVVVINEVDYDQPGTDGAEFVELKNVGTTDADLSAVILELVNGNGGGAAIYQSFALPAQSLAAGEYFVVCGDAANVPNCDFDVSPNTNLVQNGAPDAVSILYNGELVDVVSYEGDTAAPYTEGSGVGLEDPGDGSISRCEDGVDTDQNNVDFAFRSTITPGAANDCGVVGPTITKIHDVQGAGSASPIVGLTVTIEGVVVGDFQGAGQIGGFHVQEEDLEVDADPLTSEGVYVYAPYTIDVSIGDTVRVTGEVDEYYDLTQVKSFDADAAELIDPVGPASPAIVELPVVSDAVFEAVEGMSVVLPQALVIAEYFNFDRFGEIVLTTDRAAQPTAVYEPGSADAAWLADLNARSRITIDDGRGGQNPDPAIHPNGGVFDLSNRFRGGDTITNMPGVMDYAYGNYKVQMNTGVGGDYAAANPRPLAPAAVGGDVTVATFNVLNYFTTLDNAGPICGPDANQDCRGADTAEEFTRQKTKIVSAIVDIDADVVGLMEIENDAADVAVEDLVDGLNAATAPGTYANIATGPVGPDAIRVALIYKPASVTPYGAHAVLEGAFLDPNNLGGAKNRAALAQSFVDNANGGVFTVAVNHLKSKGSECGAGDDDAEQGSCNLTRTLAAGMLADWLQTDPTGSGDGDFLIIGDLNSYDKEDPIDALVTRGYADLVSTGIGEYAYSYVYSGQWGYLDYVMANAAAAPQVTGTTIWHINADEPDILDYDTSYKQPAQQALYEPNAFRSSDHDPVIVGLELTVTPKQAKNHSIGVLSELLPTGNRYYDWRITKAIRSIEDSLNPVYWVDDFHLTDKGNKVFDEEKKAVKDLMRVHGSVEAEVDAVIAALVKADEELAATAIDDAVAAGGSQRYIDKALKEMEEAQKDLDRNRPDKAIDHYKKAWQYAQKALAEAPVRFATFNASLNRYNAGDLMAELSAPGSAQPATIAEIIQRNRPDVVLINEFDYDAGGVAAEGFQSNYLSIPQNGAAPIVYPYRYVAPSNTGVPSGFDLDNNGFVGGGNDAFGFGYFEGQYAFVVYSMYPIDVDSIRTFQNFLWKDMPGALLPEDEDGAPWFTDEELDVVRLSSKNHVDVPISVGGEIVHFLVSHPTPPVFDGPEDRNGKRNYDEIRFWADYVGGGNSGKYIYDDAGGKGGLSNNALFVIAGDQNSDPFDGDSYPGAAQLLLDHPRINDKMTPSSLGGPEQAGLQGGINDDHLGDPAFDTADFADWTPGNLRADYVLPRNNMTIAASGVFWPEESDPLFPLVGTYPFPSSDHRLVWIDIDM